MKKKNENGGYNEAFGWSVARHLDKRWRYHWRTTGGRANEACMIIADFSGNTKDLTATHGSLMPWARRGPSCAMPGRHKERAEKEKAEKERAET